ncbi:hypothetical protein [Streptosporangium carneum]|uniref:ABC transporter n=1 Tax=Streptosporangium carneum TaxID=47481 RepID=A0A9W6I8H1_9ACTN|nr:hypothetical protein [Streptosporangium carneum]GLK13997.1 ABC transporter [Streptosporangium carneum]
MNALARAVSAEWLKLRSVRSTWWFAGGALLTMLLVAVLEAEDTAGFLRGQGRPVEPVSSVLEGVEWVQLVFGSFGMLAVTSEYATRGIVVTLACTPSRTRLLLAKTAVVGAAVFVAGGLTAVLGVAASAPLLQRYWEFDAGQVAGRILAMAAYMALVAALALGLGTLIRRSAGTVTVLFVLLYVLPLGLQGVAGSLDVELLVTVAGFTPGPAGERFMAGEPAFGLVLTAWAVAAVVAGVWVMRRRDA